MVERCELESLRLQEVAFERFDVRQSGCEEGAIVPLPMSVERTKGRPRPQRKLATAFHAPRTYHSGHVCCQKWS